MSYSEGNSYEEILARCLSDSRLSDVDKRVGSIIYDALAPLCLELAEAYVKMDIMNDQDYLLTATGENLDRRVYDYGIVREEAVKAQKIGVFKAYQLNPDGSYILVNNEKVLIDIDVPIGSRFSVPNNSNLIFVMKEKRIINGVEKNILECETAGTAANTYTGTILPITPILNLVKAELGDTVVYGEDKETDEELRKRTQDYLNYIAFGGNIEDYINKVGEEDGVGAVKVFPAYVDPNKVIIGIKPEEGEQMTPELIDSIATAIRAVEGVGELSQLEFDGSVRVSVVSSNYSPMSDDAIAVIQEHIDPLDESGFGASGYGIAPIGHNVTIMTPTEEDVTVQLTVTLKSGADINVEKTNIEESIGNYIDSVRKSFGQDVRLEVVVSSIIAKIINDCPNVTNVTNVTLNGTETNKVVYTDTAEEQYLPKLSTVTITEG